MANDAEAPPPSYDSIFGQLQAQKEQSTGVVDYAKNATGLCCGKIAGVIALTLGIICCIAFGLALPIAEIVIGAKYLHDCPNQDYLTIYLIVMGVFSIVSGCTGGGSKAANREEEEEQATTKQRVGSCCNSLVGMFLTAWFICGNVWVFRMNECVKTGVAATDFHPLNCFTKDEAFKNNTVHYCEAIVYDFVYYETIAKWALIGLFLVIGCLCCCVMCCAYCCSSKPEDKQ